MNRRLNCLGMILAGIAVFFQAPPAAAEITEIVLVSGISSDSSGTFMESPVEGSADPANPDTFRDIICDNRNIFLRLIGVPVTTGEIAGELGAFGQLGAAIGGAFGIPQSVEVTPEQGTAIRLYGAYCGNQTQPVNFFIIYSSCSMTMFQGQTSMRWVLPSDGGDATMQFFGILPFEYKYEGFDVEELEREPWNQWQKECHKVPGTNQWDCTVYHPGMIQQSLELVFQDIGDQEAPIGELDGAVEVTPEGGSDTMLGVPVREYSFKYEGNMNSAILPTAFEGEEIPFGIVSVITDGTAWITTEAPGAHVIKSFYSNLYRQVVPAAKRGSLFGGMFEQMAELTRHGVPLQVDQNSAVRIVSIPTFGKSARSSTAVTGVASFLSETEWCHRTNLPDDWGVVSFADLSGDGGGTSTGQSGGAPGAAGAGGPQPEADIPDAQTTVEQEVQKISPMKQKLLRGLGIKLPGMSQESDTGASVTSRSGPTSESLMTESLDESVRNHLQALGYEPGDSEVDLTIAISQFQAEKGIEITGEISQQLLLELSAAVDGPNRQ